MPPPDIQIQAPTFFEIRRIYGVRRDGTRYELPVRAWPAPGDGGRCRFGIPDCHCGAAAG